NSAMLRNLGKSRTAILTGWAVEPNCRFRYQCDAAFPLSDHADFPELLEMVKRVQPRKIYTLHGFAADFAQTLRELGYDAQALSQQEQLALGLAGTLESASRAAVKRERRSESVQSGRERNVAADRDVLRAPTSWRLFYPLALTCARISNTASKLEK